VPGPVPVSDYDYDLPKEMIAQRPSERRDGSRLLVLDRARGRVTHTRFREVGRFLSAGDLLVLNDTRVIPARLVGRRTTTGRVEMLLVRDLGKGRWEAMVRCHGKPRPGEFISFEHGRLTVRLLRPRPWGYWEVAMPHGVDLLALLEEVGRTPLPPYVHRGGREMEAFDRKRYQTVYARRPGAVAAPTAGLHFTDDLMDELERAGVRRAFVTLHVGPGTFRPIRTADVRRHRMESEFYRLPADTARAVRETRRNGHRVVAVGTTTCRVLESVAAGGEITEASGWTDLFICPPYRFRAVDALITNFHLPRSTLLVLVAAFAGVEPIMGAYEEARRLGYRFYSYGDAMLIQ